MGRVQKVPNLMIAGPPGAGKGIQSTSLASRIVIPHICVDDSIGNRVSERTHVRSRHQKYLDAGRSVVDDLIGLRIARRLAENDTIGGFVLDGFPRTVDQAMTLGRLFGTIRPFDAVLVIDAPERVVTERILARGGIADTREVVRRRWQLYSARTLPMLDMYGPLVINVDGVGSVEAVQERIWNALSSPRRTKSDPSKCLITRRRNRLTGTCEIPSGVIDRMETENLANKHKSLGLRVWDHQ
jgi:adenylate kinase